MTTVCTVEVENLAVSATSLFTHVVVVVVPIATDRHRKAGGGKEGEARRGHDDAVDELAVEPVGRHL